MATRGGECRLDTGPVQLGPNDRAEPALPAAPQSIPESIPIPLPEPRNNGESPPAGALDPSHRESLPKQGIESGPSHAAPQDQRPVPAGKEAVPAQAKPAEKPPERPAEKPPIPPLSSNNPAEPIILAPGETDSSFHVIGAESEAGGGRLLELSEAVPATFFAHSPTRQTSFSD